MKQETEEFAVYPSRLKLTLLAAMSLMFVWMAIYYLCATVKAGGAAIIFGVFEVVVCCGFFGTSLLIALWRLLVWRPLLVINEDGLYVSAVGLVRWEEIEDLWLDRDLFIKPRDWDDFLSRQPRWRRRLLRSSRFGAHGIITISGKLFSIPLEEVCSHIIVEEEEEPDDDDAEEDGAGEDDGNDQASP